MIFIGIDNGLDGAVAVLNDSDNTLKTFSTPFIKEDMGGNKTKRRYDIPGMINLLKPYANIATNAFAVLESAQAMPKQGVTSMFSIGYGFGIWSAILACLKIPHTIIRPQKWQGKYGISGDTKAQAYLVCERIFPMNKFKTERGRVLDGHCDATLMADYAKSYYNNQLEVKT